MFDVTALGELLIDFTPSGLSKQGNVRFERNPGGAPANVLACAAKLGCKTSFIGKVGDDMFGHFLADTLKEHNINISGLKYSKEAKTSLAFVQLSASGDRSFSFYRNPGADTMLSPTEVEYDLIKNSRIFHFGSLSLTDEPSKSATLAALSFAKDNGCIISYDPNLRPVLWKNLNNALSEITSTLGYSDILKISEDELEFITGIADLEKGSLELYKRYGIKIILITRGANGCFLRFRDRTGSKPTFTKCKTIDTTGAGDAFLGGFLFSLLSKNLGSLDELDWHLLEEMTVFSNAVASLSTQKKGAIPAMPGLDEINELLRTG